MSGRDRRPYLSAVSLTQELLDECHDNLECRLETVVEIETPDGFIYASDRNKYVGGRFYEALLNFPEISRTVGEWLSNELEFSTLTLDVSNVDGRFNKYLPAGGSFGGWIGKNVTVKIGIAESEPTYKTIFSGVITDVGGFKRSTTAVTIIARDKYDSINVAFPNAALKTSEYPDLDEENQNKILPVVYGDWTTGHAPSPAPLLCFVTNGNDPAVNKNEISATVSGAVWSALNHRLKADYPVRLSTDGTLPTPFNTTTTYYVVNVSADAFGLASSAGGAAISATSAGSGSHKVQHYGTATNVGVRISSNELSEFITSSVFLKRSDSYFLVPAADVVGVVVEKNEFEIEQGGLWVDGEAYQFQSGDTFCVKAKGKDLGSYSDNIVWQARDILMTFGGMSSDDFDLNWIAFRDAVTIKSRVWVQEPETALTYALSMLEQVRLEAFISRDLKMKINSLRFDDWESSPSFSLTNFDIERGSFKTTTEERNLFNRAQGFFSYIPERNENARATAIYKNDAAISQIGKEISKKIVFPNLYIDAEVVDELKDIIRIASSTIEIIESTNTWRTMLLDIGDFMRLNISIGSVELSDVPSMIRSISYDPAGLRVTLRCWSFLMVPFYGWEPSYSGIVGGYNAPITAET